MRSSIHRARHLGVTVAALLALGACDRSDQPDAPAEARPAAQAPPAAPLTPPPPPPESLRTTEPDPAVLGQETSLPGDVPLPQGARALHPPMRAAGTTRASFEVDGGIAPLQDFYRESLKGSGWSLEAEKELESQLLLSARKDERELSVAMSEGAGRTQIVILVVGE